MKINELIKEFTIYCSNEEAELLEKVNCPTPYVSFNEREQFIIKNLIHKSLLTKINNNGYPYVVRND